MANSLIVVDSEAKAETINNQLKGLHETWLVRATPFQVSLVTGADSAPGAPRFRFIPVQNEEGFVEKLESSSDHEIYLAFDNDQRGEYWSWMISEFLSQISSGGIVPKRLICTGLNQTEIEQSMMDAAPVSREQGLPLLVRTLFNSAFSIHLKRLIGTQNGPGNLPLTVHSLTALFFINDREQEIACLATEPKWQLSAEFTCASGEFTGKLKKFTGVTEDGLLYTESQAKQSIALMRRDGFIVSFVSRIPFTLPPPKPYSLVGLLHDAQVHFNMPLLKAFVLIQSLYYGVSTPSGRIGLIASYLPLPFGFRPEWFQRLQDEVVARHGSEGSAKTGEWASITHAIIPLRPEITEEDLHGQIDDEACSLYGLIRKRALAGFLDAAQGENIEVELVAGEACTFQASARRVLDKGFLSAFLPPGEEDLLKQCPFTDIDTGQVVQCRRVKPEKAIRFQDKFYTLESLFTDLAEFSIKPESSTVTMFQDMLDKDYLKIDDKGFLSGTERAATVVDTIKKVFPSMPSLNLTAYIEQTMVESLSGRKTLEVAINQFHQTMNMHGRALVRQKSQTQAVVKQPLREQIQASVARASSRKVIKAASAMPSAAVLSEKQKVTIAGIKPSEPSEPEPSSVKEYDGAREQNVEDSLTGGAGLVSIPEAVLLSEQATAESLAEGGPSLVETSQLDQFASVEVKDEQGDVLQEQGAVSIVPERAETPEPPLPGGIEARIAKVEVQKSESVPVSPDRRESATGKLCPVCGRGLLLKEDRYGRFWSCSGFPSCRHSEAHQEKIELEIECPVCHAAKIMRKRTPTGKDLFVCPHAGCDFVAWSRPHAVPCPVCSSPFLVEKREVDGSMSLRCPRAGCGYGQALPGAKVGDSQVDAVTPVKKKVFVRRVAGAGPPSSGSAVRRVRVVKRKS